MPIFESACPDSICPANGRPVEHYYPRSDSPLCACEECGGPTRQLISTFNHGLMGNIELRHVNKNFGGIEGKKDGSHWAYERNTPDGKPRAVRIDTFQDQREFAKREGLYNPSDISPNIEIGSDGKSVSSRGMPGCW